MSLKKLMVMIICMAMLTSLAACGSSGGGTATPASAPADTTPADSGDAVAEPVPDGSGMSLEDIIPDELTEIVVYSQLANYNGEQGGWFAEVLKEKFNVKFLIINEGDGTFETRMSSGNLGDIVVFGNDGEEYLNAVEAGMLFDWEDDFLLDDFGPYIKENMSTALEKNRNLSGGNVYGFGHNVSPSPENHEAFFYYPYIRFDLYKQLGYPEIATLEDFIPVLEEMQKLEPTTENGTKTYGISMFPDWDGTMVMMVKSTGALYGYDEFGMGLYDAKTQTYEDALAEDGMYLRALKFYNTMYQKGLLDPDSMTQTSDDSNEKYTTGAAFFNPFSWMANPFNTAAHTSAGKFMGAVAAKDQQNLAYGLTVYGSNRIWAIGSKSNYPELCMAIINWLSTPEGTLTRLHGPRGLMWEYNDAGNTYLTDLGLECILDKETVFTYGDSTGSWLDGDFKPNNTTWSMDATNPESASGETFNYEFWQSTLEKREISEMEQEWRAWSGHNSVDDYLEANGNLTVSLASDYTMGTRDAELDTTWSQVTDCIKQGSWQAMYAATDAEYDAIVAKMITDAKAYGYDQCVEWTAAEALLRKAAEDKVR